MFHVRNTIFDVAYVQTTTRNGRFVENRFFCFLRQRNLKVSQKIEVNIFVWLTLHFLNWMNEMFTKIECKVWNDCFTSNCIRVLNWYPRILIVYEERGFNSGLNSWNSVGSGLEFASVGVSRIMQSGILSLKLIEMCC